MEKTWRTPAMIVFSAGVILWISMGTRQTFGLFLFPMTTDLGWGRETFAIAIAIQNLLFGLLQPGFGVLADKFGSRRVLYFGGACYAGGLFLMSTVATPLAWNLGAGVLMGIGLASTSFSVVLGAVGRAVPEHKRSMALGIASTGGSVGQFVMVVLAQLFMAQLGWQTAFLLFAVIALSVFPLSAIQTTGIAPVAGERSMPLKAAFKEAMHHRGYWLLIAGFFVCGFQLGFISNHLPAYLRDNAMTPAMGATALVMIGFFNIIGSYACGYLGGKYSKKYLLAGLYLGRAAMMLAFVWMPLSSVSILVFAGLIGLTWLATVPLTSGLVGQIFGVQYLSTLFGIVFFTHQVGGVLGVWLAGYLFDLTGSYEVMWYISMALSVAAALLHWPINEQQVQRLRTVDQLGTAG